MASIPPLLFSSPLAVPPGGQPFFGTVGRHAAAERDGSLPWFAEVDIGLFPPDTPLYHHQPKLFAIRLAISESGVVDPRRPGDQHGEARVRAGSPGAWAVVADTISERLEETADAGATGIRLRNAHQLGTGFLSHIADAARRFDLLLLVDADRLSDDQLGQLRGKTDAFVLREDGRSETALLAARERLRVTAPVWLEIEKAPIHPARLGPVDGLIARAPSPEFVEAAATWLRQTADYGGEARALFGPSSPVMALLRAGQGDLRESDEALLVLANRSPAPAAVALDIGPFQPAAGTIPSTLEGAEICFLPLRRTVAVETVPPAGPSAETPRLVLDEIEPSVDGGAFPVKRVVGETVPVRVRLYGDGHEQLACELHWRALDEADWTVQPMQEQPLDGWCGTLKPVRLGGHEFVIEAWLDRFGGFRRDFAKKRDAGVAIAVDYSEGRQLAERAIAKADTATREAIAAWLRRYDAAAGDDARAVLLLADDIADAMRRANDRPHRIRSNPQRLDAERIEARFSSWYELFPRSQTDNKTRHGTFADVVHRLPQIRAMGFDTLYFPPIHPIGRTNRKGPNNTLTPGPDDVGSPYAIGSVEGGHDAIHPALGSFADFEALVAAARKEGLEIAIDFAIQCSPDHPWLKEHPGWFAWRPDGSMKYAENPPKKYQDIVNVDFYGPEAVPTLWIALRDVVLHWIGHGVKTFRVDNPHTKPLPFWEWMIGSVRAIHPDAIFLAEAFTRPSMMYRLAKVGFSQSYTYFTWRNGKQELVDYITELTTTAPKEFYRPHFFVNTPDINPPYLQSSGRPGFRIRAVLAATLSGLFGVYSGFELCESAPLPGKEEYLDSEKYEIRPRDWQAPGNIIADLTLLNRLRRTYPALQTHLNTRFTVARNDAVIAYAKPAPDGSDLILILVNLDPHRPQEAHFEVPLWEFGLPDGGSVHVEDLAAGYRFDWTGKDQWIRLDPQEPYRIWRIWSTA